MNARDVGVVTGFEIDRTLRSRHGLIFVGAFVLAVVASALQLRDAVAEATRVGRNLDATLEQLVFEGVAWWTELSPGVIRGLFDDHPPLLLMLFAIVLGIVPAFTMLLGFDQTASDIQTRHARYLLVRTDRTSLFVGKALAAWLLVAGCMAIAVLAVAAVLLTTPAGIGGLSGALYLGRVWVTVAFFALPFVALLALTGAWLGRPFLALVVAFAIQFGVWLIATLGGLWDERLTAVQYAFPTALKYHLVSDDLGDLLAAVAHQGAFAIALLALGLVLFRRRDV